MTWHPILLRILLILLGLTLFTFGVSIIIWTVQLRPSTVDILISLFTALLFIIVGALLPYAATKYNWIDFKKFLHTLLKGF